jgi:integrase
MLICQYAIGGKQRRLTLGSVKLVDAATARGKAKDILAAVRLGRDPAGEKLEARVRAAETFGAAINRFLARQKGRLKPRSYKEVARHLEKHSKRLHGLAMAKIDRRTIASLLTDIAEKNGATAADRVRASVSAFFTWASKEGLADANPVSGTNKAAQDTPRDRVLDDDELREIWSALPSNDYGPIVKLLMLTGQRREEIGGLRWSETDLDKALITLPLPASRTRGSMKSPAPMPSSRY